MYIICAQNFCSRATTASTNGTVLEQKPLHFEMILESSNEEKI